MKSSLFRSRTRLFAFLTIFLVACAGLAFLISRLVVPGGEGPGGTTATPQSPDGSGIILESASSPLAAGSGGSLHFRLSKGQARADTFESLPVAAGTPLSQEEIQRILDRLPTPPGEEGDSVEFQLPERSLPPPLTGDTITEPFPPPPAEATPDAVASGPLEVLRFAPEGEIPLAPFLSVTFNQPMVPLATLEELAAADVPVRLTPAIPGVWRWLGTKTLTFEYQGDAFDRFPMATEFVAEIPAGTTSATGGVLAQAVTWRFSTPPPQMQSYHPTGGPQPLEPVIFVAFDQLVDPEAVLATIAVTAGGQPVAVRLASEEEIAADEAASYLAENASEGRWLAFRAQQPLPTDTTVNVTIGPGTPSAEGPLTTPEAQSFSFYTYAALQIVNHYCGWSGNSDCPPFTPLYIEFNNPLDVDAFTGSMIQIEPELPGATVNLVGSAIEIQGATQGRTTYRVTVDGATPDIFGQKLGQAQTMSFEVGSAPPSLGGPNQPLVTLDPSASRPVLSVYAINYSRLHVRAYAVEPADWPAYKVYLRDYYQPEGPPTPPGREVLDETIRVEAEDDALTEVAIDLSQALEGEYGHLIVVVEPPRELFGDNDPYNRPVVQAWVQVTQIGLDAFTDHSEMVAWTTALENGAPLANVALELAGVEASTGADGIARLDLPPGGSLLVAHQGEDTAILPANLYYWDDYGWQPQAVQDELRWYVFDDRQMYLPGEEVHVKGWLRHVGGRQDGDVGLVGDRVSAINYHVMDPLGNELDSGQLDVNALGGFDLAFTLPENSNLGYATLRLSAQGNVGDLAGIEYYHGFQVQEFRRPEFEVSARNESEGPYFVGDNAVVAVSASYFAGGPLPNAEVTWSVSSQPGSYTPPNWPDFIFGVWTPWWFVDYGYDYGRGYESEYYGPYGPVYGGEPAEIFTGTTDASGTHYLQIDFEAIDSPQPYSLFASATVMDVNRQAWGAATSLLVHPAGLYVGLRSERTFVELGEPLEIETIVTDLDGNAIAGRPIQIRAARLEWNYNTGEEDVDVQECTVQSAAEPVSCTFDTMLGGSYRITASVTDDQGRLNQSQFTRWVSGGEQIPARNVEQETATLIPDKETYQPGDVAEILVQSPFSPAEGLLTVSRSGFLYTERFQISEGTAVLRVPIEEGHIPDLNVQVDLVGAAPRTDDEGNPLPEAPARPAFATGSLSLSVSMRSRTLSLQVTPQETALEPGGETAIDVLVTDANGNPVAGAELAVVVVDEAILALTNYQLADPVAAFYYARGSWISSTYGRSTIILARPDSLLGERGVEVTRVVTSVEGEALVAQATGEPAAEEAPAAPPAVGYDAAGVANQPAQPIQVRTNFNPLATFAPSVQTGGDGRAQVAVQLPDNLTRYRVMVVAVAGEKQFGSGESNLTARLPLMVRPSAPRFLNFGDQFELPVVLQNQTGQEMVVDVVVQASNVELTSGPGLRVTVPANDRIEVRFPATTISAGTARFQIAAVSGEYADAATVVLPVYTPATTEAFAVYGVIDEGAIAQPVAAIEGVFPQFGGLEIQTSSTALQALTDAVLYLVDYPYECSEQLASRILAVAALRDVLAAFEAEGLPAPAELEAAVQRDIERLQSLQNFDGGFPVWQRGYESIPFYSIHAAHALQRAQLKGFAVPSEMVQSSLGYLRDIESYYPYWYDESTRQSLSAYAIYVRHLLGDTDAAKADRLLNEAGLENLSLEALAWLWPVLDSSSAYSAQVEAIGRRFNNRAVETAGAANFTTSYGDQAYLMLHSDRRTDGIILDALITVQPESDLIPKVVTGLLANQTRGRWSNTQENVFILLALDHYFNTFEAQTPDFVASIWLGDIYAGSHTFAGRTTEQHETAVPMSYLVGGEAVQNLILSKEGPGRLYYRLGLSYAPDDLALEPLDMGFAVQRVYEAVDDPGDVFQDAEGRWHIKAGARVRVRVTMATSNRRYHVALVDPLPAGLEIINPALAVSGDIPQDPNDTSYSYGWWWWGTWYEHQNMRDERAEAFTTLLWDGVYTYSYVARATTPGVFVVPPAKAEEMYSPEVFGRSGSDWVIVE
ncbi:MAG: MG2 domain-containing protein [Chloroflexi bacterium]|nr:MG2 domain-containing protein [Chloroflexota bacterium]MCI0578571.1 MG2 domain-containing protein [Chloroflexota bacterium]MCI0647330.1 MG2 domain-containing protein [Chloroflexota bacterium]MCI0727790.1 MG2 domain-containing protein [Chloroflexota bacterium]